MRINVTAGKILNKILEGIYQNEKFIPFNEAMINGSCESELFSPSFMAERAKTHNVTLEEYKENMSEFISFIENTEAYSEVVLWFGDEPFCRENVKTVLQALADRRFKGRITLNTVIEETGKIVKTEDKTAWN